MTAREPDNLPIILVIVATADDAVALAPLGGVDDDAHLVLVATGPDPMRVDGALDDLGALAGRILLLEAAPAGPVAELTHLLPRLDDLFAGDDPAAVVVRGGSATALAAAQAAAWRGVPVVEIVTPDLSSVESVNQAAVAGLTGWQVNADAAASEAVRVARAKVDGLTAARLVCLASDRPPGLSA